MQMACPVFGLRKTTGPYVDFAICAPAIVCMQSLAHVGYDAAAEFQEQHGIWECG